MRYQVTFRKRFNQEGEGSDSPQTLLNLPEGVVEEAQVVQETEPGSVHEETMDEDDDFLAFGSEIWEYVVVDSRKDEFIDALKESGVVLEYDEIEDEDDEEEDKLL